MQLLLIKLGKNNKNIIENVYITTCLLTLSWELNFRIILDVLLVFSRSNLRCLSKTPQALLRGNYDKNSMLCMVMHQAFRSHDFVHQAKQIGCSYLVSLDDEKNNEIEL